MQQGEEVYGTGVTAHNDGLHLICTVCNRLWHHLHNVLAYLNSHNDNFAEVSDMELDSVILHPSSGPLTHLGRKGVFHSTCRIIIQLPIKK